ELGETNLTPSKRACARPAPTRAPPTWRPSAGRAFSFSNRNGTRSAWVLPFFTSHATSARKELRRAPPGPAPLWKAGAIRETGLRRRQRGGRPQGRAPFTPWLDRCADQLASQGALP